MMNSSDFEAWMNDIARLCRSFVKSVCWVMGVLIVVAIASVIAFGQSGGTKYTSKTAIGSAECIHGWGRTAVVRVKAVTVQIDGDYIRVDATIEQPILDGKQRSGYFFPSSEGKLTKEFPDGIQVLIQREITGIGDKQEIHTVRTAIVYMKAGKPDHVVFTQTDYATFDVRAFLPTLIGKGVLAERTAASLAGFDVMGNRIRTFQARF